MSEPDPARSPFTTSSELEPPHPTDIGNGERFARDHRDHVRFCHPWGKWLVWDTCRWALDTTGRITALAKLTIKGIYAEAAYAEHRDDRAKLSAHAVASEGVRRLTAMLMLAASEPGIPVARVRKEVEKRVTIRHASWGTRRRDALRGHFCPTSPPRP